MLEGIHSPDDAFLVKRLREAGAVLLGKANLSDLHPGGRRAHLADR